MNKQIKWGAVLSYLAIAVNIVSGLVFTPWMVDTIGQSQYGLYTLANSLITLFLVDFGLSSATSRYLSKYRAEGNLEAAEQFMGAVYKLYFIIDAIILSGLIVLFFFLDSIYVKLTPEELEQFKVVYIISGLFSVINFPFVTFNGVLTAFEKFIPLKIADLLYRLMHVGFTVAALLMDTGLYGLVTVHAAVGILVLLFKFIVIRRTVPMRTNYRNTATGIYKEIFTFSIWVTISSLALRLIFNITPSILGIVANSAAIAVFGIVTTIEGYTYTITNAINGMFMPRISQIMTRENYEEPLNELFLNVGKFQYILNGLIVVGFSVIGKSFVELWMGPEYELAFWGGLLIIVPGMFYNSLQIAHTTVVVTNKVRLTSMMNVAIGVLNVVLSFPLSYYFGALGACMAICITYIVRLILCNVLYHRILPLNIPRFIRKCYLRMSMPILLSILAGFVVNDLIPDRGWMVFLLKAGIITVIYGVLTLLLGTNRQERDKLLRMLRLKK